MLCCESINILNATMIGLKLLYELSLGLVCGICWLLTCFLHRIFSTMGMKLSVASDIIDFMAVFMNGAKLEITAPQGFLVVVSHHGCNTIHFSTAAMFSFVNRLYKGQTKTSSLKETHINPTKSRRESYAVRCKYTSKTFVLKFLI